MLSNVILNKLNESTDVHEFTIDGSWMLDVINKKVNKNFSRGYGYLYNDFVPVDFILIDNSKYFYYSFTRERLEGPFNSSDKILDKFM